MTFTSYVVALLGTEAFVIILPCVMATVRRMQHLHIGNIQFQDTTSKILFAKMEIIIWCFVASLRVTQIYLPTYSVFTHNIYN